MADGERVGALACTQGCGSIETQEVPSTTAAAPEDGGVDAKIFSVFVRVVGALASYEACKEKRHSKVTANTRVSTIEETLHKSALATLAVPQTSCVDDKLKQLKGLVALPLNQTVTEWYQGVPAGHSLAQVQESYKARGIKRQMMTSHANHSGVA